MSEIPFKSYDQTPFPRGKVPPPLDKVIRFAPGGYKPIVYWNDWWNLQEDYKPINKTDEKLNLRLTFQPLSLFKVSFLLIEYVGKIFRQLSVCLKACLTD